MDKYLEDHFKLKGRDFRKALKYAAIRPILDTIYNLVTDFRHTSDIDFNIYGKYYRPRSHRVEVAASRDPRANGGSTLKFA
ncbi:hypothetical protein V1477_012135 [Vespula maculifrons]|uniref:Uncharacterized protein n=1 Tax=Vespula maculifrons TaxID=7453 RepID=A0ABD2BWQ1_VESMC